MSDRNLTAGAQRAISLADRLAREWKHSQTQPGHLLWALMSEESQAFERLRQRGLTSDSVIRETLFHWVHTPISPGTPVLLSGKEGSGETHDCNATPASDCPSPPAPLPGVPGRGERENMGADELSTDELSTDEVVDALSRELRQIIAGLPTSELAPESEAAPEREPPAEPLAWKLVLSTARCISQLEGRHAEVSTEHLLAALASVDSPVKDLLLASGFEEHVLGGHSSQPLAEPMPVSFQIAWSDPTHAEQTRTLRILDAAANRAREGLRVVEDYVRFTLDDAFLSRQLKELRHGLRTALQSLDEVSLISARDTQADVGTSIQTASEMQRTSLLDVARANLKRIAEATRTLEEFSKVATAFDPSSLEFQQLPARLGQIRYQLYTLEKAILTVHHSRQRLDGANLYLLLTRSLCRLDWESVLRQAIQGGVRVVQVREKEMSDRALLDYARRVRAITAESGTLFILNDRPDIAVLAEADGVHVGQEELSVADARRIVGPERLVGVSTHSIEQARQAVLDGANYLGVGPTFRSGTKSFDEFAGLDYVRQVASEIALPSFPIGGIDLTNVGEVVAAGARRIAVSGAICRAERPVAVAAELVERLLAE